MARSGFFLAGLDLEAITGPIVREWEQRNDRPFFFEGRRNGANVAFWLQAAAFEEASLANRSAAASLVDLVKAFERGRYDVLLQEAVRWQYPIWLLRPTLAAHRLVLRIYICGVLSEVVWTCRGITAGSVFATTKLRRVLLRLLDGIVRLFKS